MNNKLSITEQIKKQIEDWSTESWNDMLQKARNRDKINLDKVTSILKDSRKHGDYESFAKEKVTGHSSNGWIDYKKKGAALFQMAYETVCKLYPDSWTPAEFLLAYYSQGVENGFSKAEDLELGRALRNLPSLIREDLIFDKLNSRGIKVQKPTSDDNVHKHADIYLIKDGVIITVWFYTNTNDAKINLFEKLTDPEHRGEVSEGLNFLAPTEVADFHGWHIPSEEWVDDFLLALERPYESFEEFQESLSWGYGIFSDFKFFEFCKNTKVNV